MKKIIYIFLLTLAIFYGWYFFVELPKQYQLYTIPGIAQSGNDKIFVKENVLKEASSIQIQDSIVFFNENNILFGSFIINNNQKNYPWDSLKNIKKAKLSMELTNIKEKNIIIHTENPIELSLENNSLEWDFEIRGLKEGVNRVFPKLTFYTDTDSIKVNVLRKQAIYVKPESFFATMLRALKDETKALILSLIPAILLLLNAEILAFIKRFFSRIFKKKKKEESEQPQKEE